MESSPDHHQVAPVVDEPPSQVSGLRVLHRRILGFALFALVLMSCSTSSDPADQNGDNPGPEPVTTTAPSPEGTPGVTDQTVLFGQSAALTGPAEELGLEMSLGINTAFHEANSAGGVNGRLLELVTLDDTYEPELAIDNTLRLIEVEQVFALIGEVGTPTSRSATPIAERYDVPFIAPFTGAAFLRSDARTNVVNLRASYAQETEEMVARMTEDLGIERIAIMYQDDSFGRTGLQGAQAALERRDMVPVSVGIYPRNTVAIKTGLMDLTMGDPEGVIVVGAYRPVAALISWARHTGFDPIFITISFVGSNALARELGSEGEGVYVTQVVPFPTDDSIPVIAAYQQALASYSPESAPSFVSLEGYLAGRLAILGLESCGPYPTRSCFMEALLNDSPKDIDGFPLTFGTGDNQGSDQVFLTYIDSEGRYQPAERLTRRSP
ncbi:MAG: ABC transporter substrate-binding protein [bacterium]|nr:ABC transporter substrate-binding protein [bacterium]